MRSALTRAGLPLLLLLLALPHGADGDAAAASGVRVVLADRALLADRLRIGGKPGDLALLRGDLVAVVRKSDGVLVDFFRREPQPPSAPQLKQTPKIDGLWMLQPILVGGQMPHNLSAREVRPAGDAIEAIAELGLGAGRVRVTTSYRLHASEPKLVIESVLEHIGGGKLAHLALGDVVKWGNVDYFVEGVGRTKPTFSGKGRWVGRRGAGGDLLLRTLESRPLSVSYKSRHHGLAPEIRADYGGASLQPGATLRVRRELSQEPLAVAPRAERPGATLIVDLTDENGRPLPAKLSFRGKAGTTDPDFGNDGDETGAGRFAWSGTGRFVRTLPAGRYDVLGTSGIERDAARFDVVIEPGQNVFVSGTLPRVVTTPGWLSADLHLHQAPSVDADIGLPTRLVSIAAEGVEVAVASDHFAVTDFAPELSGLLTRGAIARRLLTIVGSEVSTVGNRFGHFNLFPMRPTDAVRFENTTPKELFAEMRAVSPDGIIQVNHPRWDDIGYFHRFKLDPTTARLPHDARAAFTWDFDAIEVYNGYDAASEAKVRKVVMDWVRLLGQGYRFTATGSSDSHKLFFVDPGLPRTLIYHGPSSSDDDDLSASVASVVAALRRGQATVTSGPILDVTWGGKGPGEVAPAGTHPMRVRVRAAPWVSVSEVEVLVGAKANRVRYFSIPKTRRDVVRLDETFELRLPEGGFVIVLARGSTPLPNVFYAGVKPLGFSNPIWAGP
ncbi:MAG: CehA/McbA family metallohydrolase [Polyangiaceae bacterium]|nr:CehA/McbA family metallohydrolase [Polyangiaceae bacterium]